MNATLLDDLNKIDDILNSAKNFGAAHLENLNNLPASKQKPELHFSDLPLSGLGATQTQELFKNEFYSNILAASGSRYWGFVTGGTTPAAIAGDWLTSVFDQNTQSTEGNGDVSAAMELHTIKMLLQLFELPADDFIGGMVTGATLSNFTGLAVARQWLGHQLGYDVARNGMQPGTKIFAGTPHSSTIKSLSMLGMGSSNITLLPTMPGRECVDITDLEKAVGEIGCMPFILIASGGTVNTVDYDDLKFIAGLKKEMYLFSFDL